MNVSLPLSLSLSLLSSPSLSSLSSSLSSQSPTTIHFSISQVLLDIIDNYFTNSTYSNEVSRIHLSSSSLLILLLSSSLLLLLSSSLLLLYYLQINYSLIHTWCKATVHVFSTDSSFLQFQQTTFLRNNQEYYVSDTVNCMC